MTYAANQCSVCHYEFKLEPDGTVPAHHRKMRFRKPSPDQQCPGSGAQPRIAPLNAPPMPRTE